MVGGWVGGVCGMGEGGVGRRKEGKRKEEWGLWNEKYKI